jgi:hypothetical protein
MLSPHEFATLMLIRQAPDQLDMNRAELDALLERQLVTLEQCASGARRAYLTGKGETFLDTLHPDGTPPRSRKMAGIRDEERRNLAFMPGSSPADIALPGGAG